MTAVLGSQCRPAPYAVDLFPGLCHHARGFQQHPEQAESRVDFHRELRGDPVALRAVAVVLLDSAFGVLPVSAEIPLANRTIDARHRVGTAHDPYDEVTHRTLRTRWRLEDPARATRGRAPACPSRAAPNRTCPR